MAGINLGIFTKFHDQGINEAQLKIGAFQGIALGAFAKIGSAAVTAFADAAAGAVNFGKQSIIAAAEAEAVTRQLENAAKNSGAFGTTAESIKTATDALDKHSTALAEMSGIDDETINKLKSRWMAVPGIVALGTDGINNLATVSADVAAATGKDIESIGLMFAKMSGDSETALSKLTRAGVVLSDEQKKVYQSLVDSNKEAEAQAYLIEQLGKKYAGSAQAMANPMDRLKVIFENFQETVGKAFLPLIEKLVPKVAEFLSALAAKPEFQAFLDLLVKTFEILIPPIMTLLQSLLPPLMDIISKLAPIVSALVTAFAPYIDQVMKIVGKDLLPALLKLLESVVGIFTDNPEFAKEMTRSMAEFGTAVKLTAGAINFIADSLDYFGKKWDQLPGPVKMILNAVNNSINPFASLANALSTLSGIGQSNQNYDIYKDEQGQDRIRLATGGIVTGPTRALIGEAGPEAVIPLDRLGSIGGGGITINVTAGMGTDGAALGEQIVNAIRRYERTSGAVFARA